MNIKNIVLMTAVASAVMTGCRSAVGRLPGKNSNEPKAESASSIDGKAIVENIMTRTSIRQYTDQPISADTIET